MKIIVGKPRYKLVYELYGLTDEEIDVINNS